jgi:hypothetical protein
VKGSKNDLIEVTKPHALQGLQTRAGDIRMTVRVAQGPKQSTRGFLDGKLVSGSEPLPHLSRSIPTVFCKADIAASGFKGQ